MTEQQWETSVSIWRNEGFVTNESVFVRFGDEQDERGGSQVWSSPLLGPLGRVCTPSIWTQFGILNGSYAGGGGGEIKKDF